MPKYTSLGIPYPVVTDKIAKTGGVEDSIREDFESLARAADREITGVRDRAIRLDLRVGQELADMRLVSNLAVVEAGEAQDEARAAAGLVSAPAGAAVLAAIEPDGAAHNSLLSMIDDRVTRRTEYLIDVRDFGTVGDESVSDSAAINAAIAAGTAAGLDVFVPNGRYKMTEPLRTLGSNLTLRLAPGATIVRHFMNNMFINGADKSTIGGHSDLIIEGGTWDANGLNYPDWGSIFCFGRAGRVRLRNVMLKNVCKSHLVELAGVEDFRGSNITFSGYHDPTGTRPYAEAFQIERMTKIGFPSFDIEDETPCKNIVFENIKQVGPDPGYVRWPVGFGGHYVNPDGVMNSNITVQDADFGECTYVVVRVQNWENILLKRVSGVAPIAVLAEGNGITRHDLRILDCPSLVSTVGHGISLNMMNGVTLDGSTVVAKTNGVFVGSSHDVKVLSGMDISTQGFDGVLIGLSPGKTRESANVHVSAKFPVCRVGVNIQAATRIVEVRGADFQSLSNHCVSLNGASTGVLVDANTVVLPPGNRVVNFASTAGKAGISGNMYPTGTVALHNGTAAQAIVGQNYPIL